MNSDSKLVLLDDEVTRDALVLTIASPARSSVTQLYPDLVQVSIRSIEDLNRKIQEKLALHRVSANQAFFSLQFSNDRTKNYDSIEALSRADRQVDSLTQLLIAKWTFVFSHGDGSDGHLHSIMVRVSERPNPGLLMQRMLSGKMDDIEDLDGEAFAAVACKIDFLENRFSSELLAVVAEWVGSLPKAEPTFGAAKWLRRNEDSIQSFIAGTFPSLAVLAALGVWMAYLPDWITSSTKHSVAWVLGSAILFLLARYFAHGINRMLGKNLARICRVPVFQLTAGDSNRMTRFLAKSQRSLYALAAGGFVYGLFKAAGLFLAGKLIVRLFS